MILVQLTDLHCRPNGKAALRACETNMLTERALRAVRDFRPRPDAVLITGDLAANGREAEYRELAAMLRRTLDADMPVYVIPGNHDARAPMRAELGHLPGLKDSAGFIQYTVEHLPVRLVMLDTMIPGVPEGELGPERLAWLEQTLAAAPDRPTMIAMHHPPFICGIRHMDGIILRDIEAFTAVVARHRQVQRIICGHHHRTVMAPLAHTIVSIGPGVAHQVELDLVTDGPGLWTLEPPAFHVHLWFPGTGIVSHTAFVERYPGPFPFLADRD